LQSAHQQSLNAVKGFFDTMSAEMRTKGEDFVRQLQNLKEPFENAAGNLRDASTTSVIQWNTMIQDFNRRVDILITAIRETHAATPLPPPLPPEPFLNAQRWEDLMEQLSKLQAQPGTQAMVDALSRVYAQLGRIGELLSNVSLVPSSSSNPPRRLVPEIVVGEKIPTVALPRGRRRDD
jgi:hypothetical protein